MADLYGSRVCARCGDILQRPHGISEQQWRTREYCSKACAASRIRMSAEQVVSEYICGKSSTEIAERAGVSGVHVRRILKREGVTLRSASEGKRISHARPDVKAKLSASASGRSHSESAKDKLRARTGAKNHNWRSGVTKTSQGYLAFTLSPANGEQAGRTLHRVIAEWKAGRPLGRGEVVHHRDGNKLNNSPDNLEVMSQSEHARLHAAESKFWEGKLA